MTSTEEPGFRSEDPQPDPKLKIALDTTYRPLAGWDIRARPADGKGRPNWEVTYDGRSSPIYLGHSFEYTRYTDAPTRGLARAAGAEGGLRFDPADWTQFGSWPELIYPTSWAESNANFAVINAWDRAAMTFGFVQLAAHTGEDFLPFFRRLFVELPGEAARWFPELGVVRGQLSFIKKGKYRSLENDAPVWDGGYSDSYYKGDLMGFFNPDRYHRNRPADPEELHSAARWLIWTLTSKDMRTLQVKASIENLRQSVNRVHRAILSDASLRQKYPGGVDGMRCDLLSVAIAAPHLGKGHIKVVTKALAEKDPIEAIRTSKYGPGGRSQNVHEGMTRRPALRNLVYDLTAEKPV